MVVEKTVKNALFDLIRQDETTISVGASSVNMKILDKATKISFSTSVYVGEDYIPPSVRDCVSGECPFTDELVRAHLTIDESTFQIFLQYSAGTEYLCDTKFKELLEEFAHTADVWRDYLDEHDKRDRIWVRK